MTKIKIIHILHSVGGVDVSLRLILSNLDSDKYESIVIHGKEDTEDPFLNNRGEEIKSYKVKIYRNINPLNDLQAISKVYDIVKNERPHLIHAHSAKGGILGKIVGHQLKIPTLHTPQAYSYLSTENGLKKSIYLKIERFFSKLDNKILASSNSESIRAIKEVGYPSEKALLFSNSIKPIKILPSLSITKSWPNEYICSVGRPSYQKNIELMIEIIKSIKEEKPDIHLVLMGVGFHAPNLNRVKKLIDQYQLSKNITLLEWTRREDIFHIIKHARLYISTARYEGLPYSVIESLALKKACVVTDADGNRDLIEDNHNGFVIFDENIREFKKKILTLLDDKSLRNQFEENSLKKFNEQFNIENTILDLEKIYSSNAAK